MNSEHNDNDTLGLFRGAYKPDILQCLANLSNDEVFTPPELANKMLDLLPQEIWSDPNVKFLDPACKTGVFLREIMKRLIVGLETKIPNLQERIDHITKNMVYGIAITELTGLISRRTVYCSKNADSDFSISKFDSNQGNIVFTPQLHSWEKGKCKFCGASQSEYDRDDSLEQHAYQFIHTLKPEEIFNMKFDVIVGNPPYQMSFGIEGTNNANAKSIYNLFIEQAIKLSPHYLLMITPSRWMTKTSQGIPDEWVNSMLQSNKLRIIHDFETSSTCFPGVNIMGGVSYFLWERDYNGKCDYYFYKTNNELPLHRFDYIDSTNSGIVIRDPNSYNIIKKITKIDGDYFFNEKNNFSGYVSPKHFFDNSVLLTSNWKDFKEEKSDLYYIKYYVNKNIHKVDYGYVSETQIPKRITTKNLHKIFIPAANGSLDIVLGRPFYGEPNSICSQTYLVIGYDPKIHSFSKEECLNIITYIKTRFFRYLVSIKKKTQNGPRGVYQFVPLQDFSKPWTDEELYKKYKLAKDEIDFIESMIRPME